MPTVHLSLPEPLYRHLKEKASEMGVQVTDLIKFYIRRGLEGEYRDEGSQVSRTEFLEEIEGLKRDVDERVRDVERRLIVLEGRYYELRELIRHLIKNVEELQDSIEEIKGSGIEPELVHRD